AAVVGQRRAGRAAGRLRDGRGGHWQDDPGGGLHSARGRRWAAGGWSRAVHRTGWGGGRLSAGAGGPRTAVAGAWGPAVSGTPTPVCPELAGADAPPPQRGRARGAAAAGTRGDAGADAAGADRGPRSSNRRVAPPPGARRPAVE